MAKRRQIKHVRPTVIRNTRNVSQARQNKQQKVTPDNVRRSKTTPLTPVEINSRPELKNINLITNAPKSKSDRVFIIGGGPSLTGFNFRLLEGEDTIVVNKTFESLFSFKYFITMDYTFITHKLQNSDLNLIKSRAEKIFFVVNTEHPYIQRIDGIYQDTRNRYQYLDLYKFDGVFQSAISTNSKTGFSTDETSFAHGSNSGFCAVQFAIKAGYKEIYLLGFDLNTDNDRMHYHDGYKQNLNNFRKSLDTYRSKFAEALALFKTSSDQKIISCSKNSYLNAFIPYMDATELLKEKPVQSETPETIQPKPRTGDLSDLLVVGYYTVNTPYQQEAQKLIASCNRLKLNHDIVGVPNLGNWQANTRFKAKFMLDMLNKHPNKRLLYVDCDAIFHKIPELFKNYECDIAVRWQDFRWRKNECLSGTIYMENNDKTRELCNKWIGINVNQGSNSKVLEQWNLGEVIEEMKRSSGLKANNLPPEYTFIFDSMRKMYPGAQAVIEHFQASRKFKNKL